MYVHMRFVFMVWASKPLLLMPMSVRLRMSRQIFRKIPAGNTGQGQAGEIPVLDLDLQCAYIQLHIVGGV